MPAPILTFKRVLLPADVAGGPSKGQDVTAIKIGVSRMGFWPWGEFDDVMNNPFSHGKGKAKKTSGLAGFQRSVGIQGSGKLGPPTFEALRTSQIPAGLPNAGEWAFDLRARTLYRGYEDQSEEEQIVEEIFKWWDTLVAHESSVHYSQQRPIMPVWRKQNPPVYPHYNDCSGTVIYTSYLADAKSPDPYGYSGYGNTNSLNDNGFRIAESDITKYCQNHLVLAFYGNATWDTRHVVAVKSPTEVYSHGREGSPEKVSSIHHDFSHPLVEIRAYTVI